MFANSLTISGFLTNLRKESDDINSKTLIFAGANASAQLRMSFDLSCNSARIFACSEFMLVTSTLVCRRWDFFLALGWGESQLPVLLRFRSTERKLSLGDSCLLGVRFIAELLRVIMGLLWLKVMVELVKNSLFCVAGSPLPVFGIAGESGLVFGVCAPGVFGDCPIGVSLALSMPSSSSEHWNKR